MRSSLIRLAGTVAAETLAAGRAAVYYPAGMSDRLASRLAAPRWSAPATRHLPVLLVHGIWHNRSWSLRLERTLSEHGYACRSLNYRTVTVSVDDAAAVIAQQVRDLAETYGVDQVHVVAHSLGGIVLRTAVARHDIGHLVASAVTLGTPHGGSPLASLLAHRMPALCPILDQLAPGSTFLAVLDHQTRATGTRWTAIYSPADEIVPGTRGRLDHPDLGAANEHVPAVGHAGLLYHPRVAHLVTQALAEADDPAGRGAPWQAPVLVPAVVTTPAL